MIGRYTADVTIVGGGILGLLSALELVKRGRSVTIVDDSQRRPASWAGGGILSPLYAWRYSEAMNSLCRDAVSSYREILSSLKQQGLITEGILNLSGMWVATVEPEEKRSALDWAAAHDVDAYACNADSVMASGCADEGVFFPYLGSIRNPRLLRQLTSFLQHSGVEFISDRVISVHPQKQGGRLLLGSDREVLSEVILLCAGAWNDVLLRQLGIPATPFFPAKGEMLLYQLEQGVVPSIMLTEDGYLIPRGDGAVLVGSTLRRGDGSDYPTVNGRYRLEALASRLLPQLANKKPDFHWAGVRPGCERDYPWVGAIPGYEGWFAAAGCYRNGLVAGPACARLLAQLVCTSETELDSSTYAF